MFLEHKGKKITQVFTSETFNTLYRLKTQANKTTLMSYNHNEKILNEESRVVYNVMVYITVREEYSMVF